MGEERTLYESESRRSIDEVIEFLQQLSQWLGDRTITFEEGDRTVAIKLPDEVVLEIEIEEEDKGKKGVKRSLEIEIEWVEEQVDGEAVVQAEAAAALSGPFWARPTFSTWARVMMSPRLRMTRRSMTLRSSRMLPGQWASRRSIMAPSSKNISGLLYFWLNWSAKNFASWGMSERRSRRGGISMGMTLMR